MHFDLTVAGRCNTGGHCRGDADDSGLYRLVLLGISRQGAGRRLPRMKLLRLRWLEISMPQKSDSPALFGKRLVWMAGIWAARVLALVALALLLRLVLIR